VADFSPCNWNIKVDSTMLVAALKWNNKLFCEWFLTLYGPGEFGSE
jgi:hypothetical protein